MLLVLAALGCLVHAPCRAAIIEETITVSMTLKTSSGDLQHDVVVTIFHDDQRQASPYLVVNHGRTSNEEKRGNMGRQRYTKVSRYLVSLGFTVLVPTRVGYGVTGGPDVESSGPCRGRDYAPAFAVAADEVEAVLRRAKTIASVDLSRGMMVGTSFGGITSVALTTRKLPGLRGAANFSGGNGGNPTGRPENPCAPDRLAELLARYGAVSKAPSLWLYSPNDRYWGPRLPRQWFRSYVNAGGKATFVELPPFGEDGHRSFSRNQPAWASAFERFVREIGVLEDTPQAGR
jgi:dienelactone hydrolase